MAGERSARRLRSVAYHEAGHALAMWWGDLRIKSVTVVSTEKYLGRVLLGRLRVTDAQLYDMKPRLRDIFERKIVALLAGPAAERLVAGRYDHVGAMDDREQALDLMLRLTGFENEARCYGKLLQTRAKNLVEDPERRKALDALADALVQHGTLTGRDAVQIMRIAFLPPALISADLKWDRECD